MKKISLKNKQKIIIAYTLVDNEDFDWLNQWKWYMNSRGYATRTHYWGKSGKKKQKTVNMATEIMKRHKLWIKDQEVDHANRNRLDNRKVNLRMATKQQNAINCKIHSTNKSGYRGVSSLADSKINPWRADICYNGERINIGYFSSKESAAEAYDKAAIKYFGEFARLNFET